MSINTVNATIQMRRGIENDFDPDKMVAGEWAVSTDSKKVWMCFAPGLVRRMATYESFEQDMEEIREILATCQDIQVAVEAFEKLAEQHKDDASESAQDAKDYSLMSKSYAVGTGEEVREGDSTDNAQYYYLQSKRLAQGYNGIIPMGTITFAELDDSENQVPKYMFNISDSFLSDERFKDGGGIYYGPGNNVVFTADEMWDVLAASAVTGVKGAAESTYRQGNISISAADIGIGNATEEKAGLVKPDGKTIKIDTNGTIVGAASGFTGTTAEVEQAIENGEIEDGEIVNITDDYDETNVELAERAVSDADGNVITETYATKNYVQVHTVTNYFDVSTEEELTNALNSIHQNTPNVGVAESFISVHVDALSLSSGTWYIIESKSNNSYAYQEAKRYGSTNNIVISKKRSLKNGTWGEWYDTSGIVDSALSETSVNAVQNKVVTAKINEFAVMKREIMAPYGYFGIEWNIDSLMTLVRAGSWDKFAIGDYFIETTTTGEKIQLEVAGKNSYFHCGDTELNKNHIVCCPRDCLLTYYKYNNTNTNAGGYAASLMPANLETEANKFSSKLQGYMTAIRRLENNNGTLAWASRRIFLPGNPELVGFSGFADGYCGGAFNQLPLFVGGNAHLLKGAGFNKSKAARMWYWTADPSAAYTTDFCYFTHYGNSLYYSASTDGGVAPLIVLS